MHVNERMKATAAVRGRPGGVVAVTVPGGAAARAGVAARLCTALDAVHALSTPLQSTLFARARGGAGGAGGGAAGRGDVPLWRLAAEAEACSELRARTVTGVAGSAQNMCCTCPTSRTKMSAHACCPACSDNHTSSLQKAP